MQSLSKSQKSTSEEDISAKGHENIDAKEKLKCSTLPSSKNRARSMGVPKSDEIDDTTDEMMDMLLKTVTSKQKSRVRRRERSSMANRKSRKTSLKSVRLCAHGRRFRAFSTETFSSLLSF